MALMLGIYQTLLTGIANITPKNLLELIGSLPKGMGPTMDVLRKHHFLFLILIGVGALTAIVATSTLITYLLFEHHDPTYGFFWGLVAVSVLVPLGMLKARVTIPGMVALLIAFSATLSLSFAVSPEEKLANAEKKYEMKVSQLIDAKTNGAPAHTVAQLGFFTLAGALGISAMILPGISGAFVLILLGVYFEVLEALTNRDFLVIGSVALGCVLGLLFFSRLLNYILAKAHDETVMALAGLMLGSLYGLWPFQKFVTIGGKRIDLEPILPPLDASIAPVIGAVLLGGAIVGGFVYLDRHQSRPPTP